jgi:hypothetical protein
MHIIVTKDDVAKYGLTNLVDPNEHANMALDDLLGLLGHGPVARPGLAVAPEHPLSVLWVDTLRLRARCAAAAAGLPDSIMSEYDRESISSHLGEVGCCLSNALAADLDAKAREAEGLTPAGDDPEAALAALVADAKALQARAVPILNSLDMEAGSKGPFDKLPVILDYLFANWGPEVRDSIAADIAADLQGQEPEAAGTVTA